MARKTVKRKVTAPRKHVEVKEVERMIEVSDSSPKSKLRDEHHAFSHVMYFLFLVSITVATFFTFQSFAVLAQNPNAEYFYIVFAILMLLWSFLFWEFGHRVHVL